MQSEEFEKAVEKDEILPIKKGDLRKLIRRGGKIAIDGHVFKVVNIDYFSGNLVMKYLPNENLFAKIPENETVAPVVPVAPVETTEADKNISLTNEEKDDNQKKEEI